MKASIVMGTFNGARYIEEQLDSLFRQTVSPAELIISDDGSTDETVSIIKSLAAHAPFPIILTQRGTTLGYARNFSEAALTANREIVLFCDQDDYWDHRKIELITHWFHENPSKSLVTHNIAICNESLEEITGNYFSLLERTNKKDYFIKGCATAIRRHLIQAAYPLPKDFGWTHDSRVHALAKIQNAHGQLKNVLVKHRLHPAQTSGYIVEDKPLNWGGKFLRQLDALTHEALPIAVKVLPLIPKPHEKEVVLEFLQTSKKIELYSKIIKAEYSTKINNDLLDSSDRKLLKFTKLLKLYFSGNYIEIGRSYRFLADLIRLSKQ